MAIIWDNAFDKRQEEMEELGEAAKEDDHASGREALDAPEQEEEELIVFSTAFD